MNPLQPCLIDLHNSGKGILKINFQLANLAITGLFLALCGFGLMGKTVSSGQIHRHNSRAKSTSKKLNEREKLVAQIDKYLARAEDAGFYGSVLVAQNNEVIWESGYGLAQRQNNIPNTSNTVFDIGSLSKQFTAAAILHLEEKGLLSVEDKLEKFLPNIPQDKADITLHQLLTHSSGLIQYAYEDDFAKTSREEAISLALNSKLEHPPGTKYSYSDTGYGLLAVIVEIASGQSFQSYLTEHLFKPGKMSQTGFYNDSVWNSQTVAHGYNNDRDYGSAAKHPGAYWGILGFGGVLTTVKDLYRWHNALENNLVLSSESTEKLFTRHIRENESDESYYGYGWTIQEHPQGTIIKHSGANDSHNSFFSQYGDHDRTLVVVLSNRIDSSWLAGETFYAEETGVVLGGNILKQYFTELPKYAR